MDRYTAASMSQNIASIGDAFMQMNDPRTRAQASMMKLQMEGQRAENAGLLIRNQYAPKLSEAQIAETNASAGAHNSQAGYYDSQKAGRDAQNLGLNGLLDRVGQNEGPMRAGGSISAPFTTYSQGAAVGGLDEMQDGWTNKGYTSTGKNLSPGVVAVNPSVHPLGQVLKDPQTGEVFIAADSHGNENPNVVDIFQPGDSYRAASGNRQFDVVGQVDPKTLTSAEAIQAARARYGNNSDLAILSNVAAGGGAHDLMTGIAQAYGLSATDEMAARQALAGQGQAMNQGEYFMQSGSDAYQDRAIAGAFDRDQLHEQNENLRHSADIMVGGSGRAGDASSAGLGGGIGKNPLDAVNGAELTAKLSAQRFGMLNEAGVPNIDPSMRSDAMAWEASVTNLAEQGVPIQTAIAIADQHHRVGSIAKAGDGWFDGDPRMQTGADFNHESIGSEEARRYGISYAMSPEGEGGNGGARMFAAGMLNPQIARMAGQMQARNEVAAPAPAMIPPMLQRPADPVPTTGGEKASDAFKPRESTDEKTAREGKSKKVAQLQSDIAEISARLKSGKIEKPNIPNYGMGGGMGLWPQSESSISNDGYNANLARLKQMETELASLIGPAPTAQTPTQVGRFQVTAH